MSAARRRNCILDRLLERWRSQDSEEGFTLIELLIVLVIMPLVIGAVAIVMITTLEATATSDPHGAAVRLADSHDAQIGAAYFVRDVQSAQEISTARNPVCAPSLTPPSDQLLGLQWSSGVHAYAVSYFVDTVTTSPAELVRYYCVDGTWSTTSVISHDVFATVASPGLVTCAGIGAGASSCAGDTSTGTTYVAVSVSCNDGSSPGTCTDAGLYPVSGSYNDGATNANTFSWSSRSANFSAADGSQPIIGAYIPTGTMIEPPVTSGSSVTLSNKTTGTGTGLSFDLPKRGVKSVELTIQESRSSFTYSLTGIPRLSNGNGGTTGFPTSFIPPLLVNGPISMGNCAFVVNGVAASNDTSGTAVSSGPNGTADATGFYTAGGSVSDPPYSGTVASGGLITSPYAGLAAPPTAPSGAPYFNSANPTGIYAGDYVITTRNWDPSTDTTYETNGVLKNPGIYVVENGLDISKGFDASGVLFYVTGGSVTLGGNGNLNLSYLGDGTAGDPFWESPPTSPPPPDIPEPVVWISSGDTSPTNPPTLTLNGNGNVLTINGAIYAPTAAVTLNGGGNSGGLNVGAIDVGTISACNGGGSVPINLLAGSPLVSGTVDAPTTPTITLTQSDTDSIVVQGEGSLAPTGSVAVYACGPYGTPSACTKSTAGVQSVGTIALTASGCSGATCSVTSPAFTPLAPGVWCFAAYYDPTQTGTGQYVSYNPSSDTTADGCFTVSGPTLPPSPVISFPSSGRCYYSSGNRNPPSGCSLWSGSVSGTATDPNGPGLRSVTLEIEAPDGKWWNGTRWVGTATPLTTSLSGPTSGTWAWTFSFPSVSFENGNNGQGTYTIIASSTDSNGNSSPPTTPPLTFTWDG